MTDSELGHRVPLLPITDHKAGSGESNSLSMLFQARTNYHTRSWDFWSLLIHEVMDYGSDLTQERLGGVKLLEQAISGSYELTHALVRLSIVIDPWSHGFWFRSSTREARLLE